MIQSIVMHGPVQFGGAVLDAYCSQLGSHKHQIWGRDKQILAIPTRLLDFRHVASLRNKSAINWRGVENRGKNFALTTYPCKYTVFHYYGNSQLSTAYLSQYVVYEHKKTSSQSGYVKCCQNLHNLYCLYCVMSASVWRHCDMINTLLIGQSGCSKCIVSKRKANNLHVESSSSLAQIVA